MPVFLKRKRPSKPLNVKSQEFTNSSDDSSSDEDGCRKSILHIDKIAKTSEPNLNKIAKPSEPKPVIMPPPEKDAIKYKIAVADRTSNASFIRHPQIASTSIKTSCPPHNDNSDSSDNEYDVVAPRKPSTRAPCNIKSAVQLTESREKGEEPISVSIPQHMDEVKRKPANAKGKALSFPNIVFYGSDHDIDILEGLAYPKNLEYVSLKSIDPSIKLAPSKVGNVLQTLADHNPRSWVYMHTLTNNAKVDLAKYTLLYGAIPANYVDCAKSLIMTCNRIYKKNVDESIAKNKARIEDMKSKNKTVRVQYDPVPFSDGELEIMLYIYWQLSTQDLIAWKDDTPREKIKQLLAYAWSLLTDPELKAGIVRFADFNNSKHISARCLLWIKMHYDEILLNICKKNGEERKHAIFIWNQFMSTCSIHHYSCSHTIAEMHRRIPDIAYMLKLKLRVIKAQSSECVRSFMSANEVYKLLRAKGWPVLESAVNGDLQHAVNNLIIGFCRLFGLHLIQSGIYNNAPYIVDPHVVGFANMHHRTVVPLTEGVPEITNPAIIRNIRKYIAYTIYDNSIEYKKFEISNTGMRVFLNLLLAILPSPSTFKAKETNTPSSWNMLTNRINNFIYNYSTGTKPDTWTIFNDEDDDEYVLNANSKECETDSDNSEEDISEEEVAKLKKPYPDIGYKKVKAV